MYVIGGYDGRKSVDMVQKYSPKEDKWDIMSFKLPIAI